MAYQNRNDFTVEVLRGLVNRVSSLEARGLTSFSYQTTLFEQLNDLSRENITLIQKIPLDIECTPGFPGAQNDTLTEISNFIANFFNITNSIEKQTNKTIDSFKQEYSSLSGLMNEHLADLSSNSHQIDSIKFTIKGSKQNLPSKFIKYQKSINNIIASNKMKKKSEATRLYGKILKIRKDDAVYSRPNIIPSAEKCMSLITENSNSSIELLKKQFSLQKNILLAIIHSNREIITNCEQLSNEFTSMMNQIDFHSDFQRFTEYNKIIRYDILPMDFKPIDLNHECFNQIATVSKIVAFQFYPYSMAKMKNDFIAVDKGELSVQKGKILLLMEDLSLNWTFAQNPYTRVMGYVPSSFLEEIGKGLGVLLYEFEAKEEILNKGDYVAIESKSLDNETYQIHSITDNIIEIPFSYIGIISEIL